MENFKCMDAGKIREFGQKGKLLQSKLFFPNNKKKEQPNFTTIIYF